MGLLRFQRIMGEAETYIFPRNMPSFGQPSFAQINIDLIPLLCFYGLELREKVRVKLSGDLFMT